MEIVPYSENTEKVKYYLVDFNSVKTEGLDGIEKLSDNDNVIIFFVKGESTVDFSLLSKLYLCSAKLKMKEIENKNMIVPVISMYIGIVSNERPDIYLICEDGQTYIKVSENVIGNETSISVQQNISGTVSTPKNTTSSSVENNKVNPLLVEILNSFKIPETTEDWIYEIINIAKKDFPHDKPKQYLFIGGELFKKFGNSKIYSAIRPYI